MSDSSNLENSVPTPTFIPPPGAMPMTIYQAGDIPDDYAALAPERPGTAVALLVVHPPMAAIMAALPEALLESVILPALEAAETQIVHRGTKYAIDSTVAPDGFYLLFIIELT